MKSQSFYKVYSNTDSIPLGKGIRYICTFEIDTTQGVNSEDVSLFLNGVLVNTIIGNKHIISIPVGTIGKHTLDISLVKRNSTSSDTTKILKTFWAYLPKDLKPIDYVFYSEKLPSFHSKNYNSFESYLIEAIGKNNIKLNGKLTVTFVVLINGKIRIENIHNKGLSETDKNTIKEIITNSKRWNPGTNNNKPVNVYLSKIIDFGVE